MLKTFLSKKDDMKGMIAVLARRNVYNIQTFAVYHSIKCKINDENVVHEAKTSREAIALEICFYCS